MVQKGLKPNIFTHKKMQVAENAACKLHFLLAFCEYARVNFEPWCRFTLIEKSAIKRWYSMIAFCFNPLSITKLLTCLTHSHTMTSFDAPGKQAFRKHWEKEKWLVTSNFSFSHSVFYPFG